jgi:hypothetical protein
MQYSLKRLELNTESSSESSRIKTSKVCKEESGTGVCLFFISLPLYFDFFNLYYSRY